MLYQRSIHSEVVRSVLNERIFEDGVRKNDEDYLKILQAS